MGNPIGPNNSRIKRKTRYIPQGLFDTVHLDLNGLPPPLPDAHSVPFPILAFPPNVHELVHAKPLTVPFLSSTPFPMIEVWLHRILTFTSIPIDLLIPPYATSHGRSSNLLKVAVHPVLPIIAFGSGGCIVLFDLRTNGYLKYKLLLSSHQSLSSLVFSRFNLLVVGTSNGEIILYNLNLSISASGADKPLSFSAISASISPLPSPFPALPFIGEVTGLDIDTTGQYIVVATKRSGTWVYDTLGSYVRLSKSPSRYVLFSENGVAVSRDLTGEIELYTLIKAGTLSFSRATVSKSGFKNPVKGMKWTNDGKLFYCNEAQEGIRVLQIYFKGVLAPGSLPRND
jgi:hypothetical protein